MASSSRPEIIYTVALPPLKVINSESPKSDAASGISQDLLSGIKFDGPETEHFKTPFAKEFADLRRSCHLDEISFTKSLENREKWDAKGGKSSAVFLKTLDNRFILKEVTETEYKSFVQNVAPKYFHHLKALTSGVKSCLVKIFSIFEVKHKSKSHYFLTMENLTFGRKIHPMFDLKGKFMRDIANGTDENMGEEQFTADLKNNNIHIPKDSKETLKSALFRDTSFLEGVNVMDYSLLVAVDQEKREIVCGIIDYIGPFNTLKLFELIGKTVLFACSPEEPTVQRPSVYMRRLLKFIDDTLP